MDGGVPIMTPEARMIYRLDIRISVTMRRVQYVL